MWSHLYHFHSVTQPLWPALTLVTRVTPMLMSSVWPRSVGVTYEGTFLLVSNIFWSLGIHNILDSKPLEMIIYVNDAACQFVHLQNNIENMKNPAERSKCIIIITVIRTRLCWWLIECWDCGSLRMRAVMSGDVIPARTGVRLTGARHRTTGGTNTLSRHGLTGRRGPGRGLVCITRVLWHYRGLTE